MTARAYATDVGDPSGLHGERLVHNAKALPFLVELYAYPSTLSLDVIKRAWLDVLPIGSCAGFKEEGIRGGRRLVTIERYVRTQSAPLHIDEPNV